MSEASRDAIRAARNQWIGGRASPGPLAGTESAAAALAARSSPAVSPGPSAVVAPLVLPAAPGQFELVGEGLDLLRGIQTALETLQQTIAEAQPPPSVPAPPAQQAQAPAPALPVVAAPVQSPHHSVDMFDFGMQDDPYVDPQKQCGVCMSGCESAQVLYPCGHYPYCGPCVRNLKNTKNAMPSWDRAPDFSQYVLTCPQCHGKAKETFELKVIGI